LSIDISILVGLPNSGNPTYASTGMSGIVPRTSALVRFYSFADNSVYGNLNLTSIL